MPNPAPYYLLFSPVSPRTLALVRLEGLTVGRCGTLGSPPSTSTGIQGKPLPCWAGSRSFAVGMHPLGALPFAQEVLP